MRDVFVLRRIEVQLAVDETPMNAHDPNHSHATGNPPPPVERYRPTMTGDVLHAWAAEAQAELDALRQIVSRGASEKASSSPATVVDLVLDEVRRAMGVYPTWPTDPLHALHVVGEEFGELTKDVLQMTYEPRKTTRDRIRTEAIQTAAMALRFLESLDIYVYQPCDQHRQRAIEAPSVKPAQTDTER